MASVTYRINGKSDNKAVDQTKKSLESLGGVAKSVNNIFKGFMALKAVQAVGRQVAESVKAFSVQQSAIVGLQKAINNNAKMTTGAMQRLVDFTGQLQGMSIYGDEQLQGQAKFLAGMQLTEDQIKSTLKAAADLAGGGIGNLESNVRNLAKTFSGLAGELGEMVPGLKNLTKEQLAHGDAVKLVAERYEGFAATMTGTLEGKQTQVNNLIGDLKEKVGALAAIGKSAFLDTMKPHLEQMNAWLGANLRKIANVFLHLPEFAKASMNGIIQIIAHAFKPENFTMITRVLGNAIENGARVGVTFFVELVGSLGDVLKSMGESLGENWWKSLINGVLKNYTTNNLLFNLIMPEDVKKAAEGWGFQDIPNITDVAGDSIAKNIVGAIEAAKTAAVGIKDTWTGIFSGLGNVFRPVVDEMIKEWERITDLPLPPAIQKMMEFASGNFSGGEEAPASGSSVAGGAPREGGTGYSIFGGTGQMIKDILSDAFGPVVEFAKNLEMVTQLMTPWQTILGGMFEVLEPIVNQLLAPLVGILKIIGYTIGQVLVPVLQLVTPIIEIISEAFVWLYNNAIMPLGNFIIGLIVEINNFFADMVNAVIGALNNIPFVDIGWRMGTMDYDSLALQSIDTTTLTAAGGGASTGSSGGASYTGAKDMYINIYFDRSYVNGDARDIALMLRNEINAAEALGY